MELRNQTLVETARAGRAPTALALLDAGADANAADWMGRTALSRACRYGHAEVASLLLARGARLDIVDADFTGPLHYAARHPGTTAETLLRCLVAGHDGGADALSFLWSEQRDRGGGTAADAAVRSGAVLPDELSRVQGGCSEVGRRDCGGSWVQTAPSDCDGGKDRGGGDCGDGVGSSDSGSGGGGCATSMTYPAARPGIVVVAVRFRENAEEEGEGGGGVNDERRQDTTASVAPPIASAEATATEEGMAAATAAPGDATLLARLPLPHRSLSDHPKAAPCSPRLPFHDPLVALDDGMTYGPEEHAAYHDQGYHIFSRFLSPAALTAIRQRVDHLFSPGWLHPRYDPLRIVALNQCGEAWIQRLAGLPALRRVVAQHCGDHFYLYVVQVFHKPAESRYVVPWHQDYRRGGKRQPCTVWVALDDVTQANGAVMGLAGWHRKGPLAVEDRGCLGFTSAIAPSLLPPAALAVLGDVGRCGSVAVGCAEEVRGESKRGGGDASTGDAGGDAVDGVDAADGVDAVDGGDGDAADVVYFALKAGQAFMHHPLLPHASGTNDTAQDRRGLVLRFRAARADDPPTYTDGTWVQDYRDGTVFLNTHFKMRAPHLDEANGSFRDNRCGGGGGGGGGDGGGGGAEMG
jgi:hypothetical protein